MTHKLIVQWLLVVTSVLPFSACAMPLTYSAEPMEARVIDVDTKQPLEGVIVTANWQLEEGTFGGNVPAGQLMVMESVTDKEGKFSFPAFGPKRAPKGHLVDRDPQLLLFKSGYEYQRLNNPYSSDRKMRLRPVRRSDWHGKTIEMKLFKGAVGKYAERFKDFNRELDSIISQEPEDCYWKKLPHTISAMMQERRILEQKGARYPFSIDQRLSISDEYFRKKGGSECGSPKDFIKGLQQ